MAAMRMGTVGARGKGLLVGPLGRPQEMRIAEGVVPSTLPPCTRPRARDLARGWEAR